MEIVKIEHKIVSYLLNELPADIQHLLKEAKKMEKVAYAPYSNFLVGSALELTSGAISTGCNQENASYPLCICAERVALYNAHVHHNGEVIRRLAVTASNPKKSISEPVSPCGACRQVIMEFENKQKSPIEIYMQGQSDVVFYIESASVLLPISFSSEFL